MARSKNLKGFNRERRGAVDYSDHIEYLTDLEEAETECISISVLVCQWILGAFFLIILGMLIATGILTFFLCN